jgi:hypothetical protein
MRRIQPLASAILHRLRACFEFVRKPCDAAMLDRAIRAAMEQVETAVA